MGESERTESRPAAGDLSPAMSASVLVGNLADKLALHLNPNQPKNPNHLFNLCLALARAVDVSIAFDKAPSRTQDLVSLLREVCKHPSINQAAVMVLMVSIKNACNAGWFTDKDTLYLLTLAKEVAKVFSDTDNMKAEDSYVLHFMSKIILRFYPIIKMGRVLVSLKIKPGYRTLVADFLISKKTATPTQEEIGLFVVRVDEMKSSSCIQTPPQANFLINGEGVQGRINASMDTEPQLPTKVTSMLNYGTNVFQAVGQFDGEYIIVVAYMTEMPISDIPVLQDYVQQDTPSDKSCDHVNEQSKISLNCPISKKRIKTPVKGHLCKHFQCFDYESFVLLNSQRPLWQCPVCDQSMSHSGIRIDQCIAKILQEVGENTSDVIISANGCWRVVFETVDKERFQHNVPANMVDAVKDSRVHIKSSRTTSSSSPLLQSPELHSNNILQLNQPNMNSVYGRSTSDLIRLSRAICDQAQSTMQSEQLPNGASYQNMPFVLPVSNAPTTERNQGGNGTQAPNLFPSPLYSNQTTRHMAQAPQYTNQAGISTQNTIRAQNYRSPCSVQTAQNTAPPPVQGHSANRVAGTRTPQFVPVQLLEPGLRPTATSTRVVTGGPRYAHQVSGERSAKENWRPSGRMRGSLSGQAYANALKEFLTPQAFQSSSNQVRFSTSTRNQVSSQAETNPNGNGGDI